MRTEADLREAFEHLADSAPDPEQVAASLRLDRRPTTRRRTALIVGVTIATTAAAVAIPVALHDRPDSRPPAVTEQKGDGSWRTWLTVTPPKGMGFSNRFYGKGYQVVGLFGQQTVEGCLLTAHFDGNFDPARIPAGSPRIDINGMSGYVVTRSSDNPVITLPPRADPAAQSPNPTRMVVWQPSPGVWTTVNCHVKYADTAAAFDRAVTLARTVSTAPRRLSSPYRISYVPKGPATTFTTLRTDPEGFNFGNQFGDGNAATGLQYIPGDPWSAYDGTLAGSDLRIRFTTSEQTMVTPIGRPDMTVNGLPAWWEPMIGDSLPDDAAELYLQGDGFAVWVRSHEAAPSRAEVLKVAQGLQLAADPLDQSTWFDAAVAIP